MPVAAGMTCAIIRTIRHCAEEISKMITVRWKILAWALLSALAASMTYAIFRGYLSPDLLMGFANSFSC